MSAPTYVGTINRYHLESKQLSTNRTRLFFLPHGILNLALLIAYLILSRRPSLPTRIALFLCIVSLSISSLQRDRSLILVYGLLVGISDCCCIILSFNLLFLFDPAREFRRRVACDQKLGKDKENTSKTLREKAQWKNIPTSMTERLYWAMDLLASLRALHWSYGSSHAAFSRLSYRPSTRDSSSIHYALFKLLLICLGVDCLKEIIALDPYFWGQIENPPPSYVLSMSKSTHFIQAYRMLVAFAVIFQVIHFLTTSGYLLFVNILGPSLVGPWGCDWAHSPPLGSFKSVSKRGLQGWWSSWWHQWFRIMVTSPANAVISVVEVRQDSNFARPVRVATAFILSGAIHACGSYTLWGPSTPIGSFLFFAVQPVGIVVQIFGSWTLRRLKVTDYVPECVLQATNVIFTGLWLLKTFPLMVDDYARGGLWLTEPFPISLLQLLGMGGEERSCLPWSGSVAPAT